MTVKEKRNAINKAVYIYAESLGYEMSDDNDGSNVVFSKPDCQSSDETIEYHRSYHKTCVLNWASDEVKADANKIEAYAEEQVRQYNI